ncbi:L,D-transpeptidase family protein [Streptomyces collinus]|uniref:L,D-transpeptidase family protein n=1 Tax=Streptomyces collinus TaxID=42684 RepID=UPI002943120E|nr:L,D-transpeptidase family protein [Streptomyces collinus]
MCSFAPAVAGALLLMSGCGHGAGGGGGAESTDAAESVAVEASAASGAPTASASASASPSASTSASVSASASAKAKPSASVSPTGSPAAVGTRQSHEAPAAVSTPHFPVPATPGNATQLITVKSSGSYATVTAWSKGASGWKAQFSTTAGRVGSNGVVAGSTRRQGTYTTPTGTYTLTEGFGVEAGGTSMPYTRVNSAHWWVEDPESKYYNSMHTAAGADFPLTESGDRGSEHLVDHSVQYAKALVIDFNRWPAVPGRGAGIFLHVNGQGATAGCVSVPRATMDLIMGWIRPAAHPRIAIG